MTASATVGLHSVMGKFFGLLRCDHVVCCLVIIVCSSACSPFVHVSAQEPKATDERSKGSADFRGDDQEESISFWVQQLGNENYLRRERASRRLVREGPAAVQASDNLARELLANDALQIHAFRSEDRHIR